LWVDGFFGVGLGCSPRTIRSYQPDLGPLLSAGLGPVLSDGLAPISSGDLGSMDGGTKMMRLGASLAAAGGAVTATR
jgi:hypothetical protein